MRRALRRRLCSLLPALLAAGLAVAAQAQSLTAPSWPPAAMQRAAATAAANAHPLTAAAGANSPTIAIIIDDVGNDANEARRLIQLPTPLTLSIMPQRPYSKTLALEAHAAGKEIMLHMPMANTRGLALGAAGLTPDMAQETFTNTLRQAILDIPYVRGMNNHMGSLLTQNVQAMQWTMAEMRHYPLYFVDSRTTPQTVAQHTAEEFHIPNLARDVFLDNEVTEQEVDYEFQRLLKIAREQGTAIAIGHPHEVTVSYLERVLPRLGEQGIAVATVSALWMMRHNGLAMFNGRQPTLQLPELAAHDTSTESAAKLN